MLLILLFIYLLNFLLWSQYYYDILNCMTLLLYYEHIYYCRNLFCILVSEYFKTKSYIKIKNNGRDKYPSRGTYHNFKNTKIS